LFFPLWPLSLVCGFCGVNRTSRSYRARSEVNRPGSVAIASSLMLGLGWGTGGLMVTLVGVVADRIGLIGALRIVTLCLIIAILLALSLPRLAKPETYRKP